MDRLFRLKSNVNRNNELNRLKIKEKLFGIVIPNNQI